MKAKFLVSLFFLFSTTQILAACFYTLPSAVINYTVSDTDTSSVNYSLNLSRGNPNDPKCDNFLIGFSQGQSNSYSRVATNSGNGTTIPYNLYKTSSSTTMLRRIEDSSSLSQILNGTIAKNSSVNVDYYFKIGSLSTTSLTRAGLYKDTITLALNSGDLVDFSAEITNTLQVNILVPKMASLSLVNNGAAFDSAATNKTLDFGELTDNEDMSFDVIVLSNAGYNLSVSSTNGQLLKLQGAGSTTQSQINYNFYANSNLKDISSSSPVSIMTGSGVTPTQGTRIPVKVVIQSVTGKDPGVYQDYVTFTIATTE
jgi:hypothetical protein